MRELVKGSPLRVLLVEVVSGAVALRKSLLGTFDRNPRSRALTF